jgi:hypothetical protein
MASVTREGLELCRHYESGGGDWLEILRAEPRALFAGELLRQLRRGDGAPFTSVDRVGVGGLVCIRARNRNVVYRLTGHDPQWDVYTGEWPD